MSGGNMMPIVRLEVERLERSILAAFNEQELAMDADIRAAIEAYCQPENIKRVIADGVKRVLDREVSSQIEQYFRTGNGREAIRRAVNEHLDPRTLKCGCGHPPHAGLVCGYPLNYVDVNGLAVSNAKCGCEG